MANLFDYKLNPRYSWPRYISDHRGFRSYGHCSSPYCHDGVSRKSKTLLGIILYYLHVFHYLLILALLSFFNQPTDVRRVCIENPIWSIILACGLKLYNEGWGCIHNSKLHQQWRNYLAYWWLHWWSNHLTNRSA